MIVTRQRIAGNAQPASPEFARPAVMHNDQQGQGHAIGTQLHRVPAGLRTP